MRAGGLRGESIAFLRLAEHAVLHLGFVVRGVERGDRIGSRLQAVENARRLSPLDFGDDPPALLSGFGECLGRGVKPAAHDPVVVAKPRNWHGDLAQRLSVRRTYAADQCEKKRSEDEVAHGITLA